jgi:ABC-type nickel/cobalt efflux system permease component RcnA
VVISTYLFANDTQLRRVIWLSFLAAMLQSVVAVAFVLVAAAALKMTSLALSNAASWIDIVSYGLITLLGLWLIARRLFGLGHGHAHGHARADGGEVVHDMRALAHRHLHGDDEAGVLAYAGAPPMSRLAARDAHGRAPGDPHYGHSHGHGGEDDDEDEHDHVHAVTPAQTGGGWREQLGVVLSIGLRPCSGALVVMVFALSQGLVPAGIASVFLMGLGTAITVGVLATVAVSAKGLARRLLGGGRGALAARLFWWAELCGGVVVCAFGVLFLIVSL